MIVLSCIWSMELLYTRHPSIEVIPVLRIRSQIMSNAAESPEGPAAASRQWSTAIQSMRLCEVLTGRGWYVRGEQGLLHRE